MSKDQLKNRDDLKILKNTVVNDENFWNNLQFLHPIFQTGKDLIISIEGNKAYLSDVYHKMKEFHSFLTNHLGITL